jgi:hypothetical protein
MLIQTAGCEKHEDGKHCCITIKKSHLQACPEKELQGITKSVLNKWLDVGIPFAALQVT